MLKHKLLALSAATALASALSMSAFAAAPATAMYKVTFVPTFTSKTHPHHYLASGKPITHFSPMIGVTYKKGYMLYKTGKKPTPGLELLSERGKHDGLMKEFDMAKKQGKVYSVFTSQGGNNGPVPKAVEMQFTASKMFPRAAVVAMIAPSPDWFVGVSNVKLYKNGSWVPSVTVKGYAYDSGGDKGKDYTSKDQDTMPKQKTKKAWSKHFIYKGSPNPIGTFVFTRVPSSS
jgi:hypothetical protein